MTDFLDQLEHDLYEAAQRRGGSRSIVRPVKALAMAALAVAVVATGIRAVDWGAERQRTTEPTLDRSARIKIVDDWGDDAAFTRELGRLGYDNVSALSRREAQVLDSSPSTSVLYRPDAETTAAAIARELELDVRPKPLTAEADQRLFGAVPPPHAADVLVIIGLDAKAETAAIELSECRPAGELDAGPISVCDPGSYIGSSVVVKQGERSQVLLPLSVTVPRPNDGKYDRDLSFPWAAAAPDRDDVLVQVRWHCKHECSNAREAFFVPVEVAAARSVDGNTRHTWNTTALGWTTDNRAIVLREDDRHCGAGGIYLIRRDGQRTFVGCTNGNTPPPSLTPSVEPRSVRSVESALP